MRFIINTLSVLILDAGAGQGLAEAERSWAALRLLEMCDRQGNTRMRDWAVLKSFPRPHVASIDGDAMQKDSRHRRRCIALQRTSSKRLAARYVGCELWFVVTYDLPVFIYLYLMLIKRSTSSWRVSAPLLDVSNVPPPGLRFIIAFVSLKHFLFHSC